MKNFNKKLLGPVQVVILAIIISALGSYAYAAWTENNTTPPGNNAEAPINVSNSSQIKDARLTVANVNPPSGIGFEVVNGDIVVDGTASGGNVKAKGFFYQTSDRNSKTNVIALSDSLNKIMQLHGVSYNLKKGGAPGIGLIAQDVQKVYPELVGKDSDGLTVAYPNLVAPLIEAVKTQQKEIDQLKAEVKALKGKK